MDPGQSPGVMERQKENFSQNPGRCPGIAPCQYSPSRFKTSKHAAHLSQDIGWFVLRRDRLNLDFQINVIVHNPYRLLYLPNELLNYICEALEEEQAKTK